MRSLRKQVVTKQYGGRNGFVNSLSTFVHCLGTLTWFKGTEYVVKRSSKLRAVRMKTFSWIKIKSNSIYLT